MRILLATALLLVSCSEKEAKESPSKAVQAKQMIYNPQADTPAELLAAHKSAAAEKRTVLLVVGGDWCPTCRRFEKTISSENIRDELDKHFVVVHLDSDSHIGLQKELGLNYESVPHLAVFANEKLVSQRTAPRSKTAVFAFLEKNRPGKLVQ